MHNSVIIIKNFLHEMIQINFEQYKKLRLHLVIIYLDFMLNKSLRRFITESFADYLYLIKKIYLLKKKYSVKFLLF